MDLYQYALTPQDVKRLAKIIKLLVRILCICRNCIKIRTHLKITVKRRKSKNVDRDSEEPGKRS